MIHVLKNAHVFKPEDQGIQHIIVASGKLLYLGRHCPNIDSTLISTETDLEGASVIPGLIDGHTHTTGGGGEAGFSTRVPAVKLTEFTSAGVTSVVGLLGTDDLIRTTSDLIAQTYSLREEGLNAWCYTGGYHFPLSTLTESAKSDIVHVECILGVGELAISDHRSSQPTFEEIIRVASEAHVAGLMTGKAGIVHFHLGDGKRGLDYIERAIKETELPSRVFNPTHVNRRSGLFEQACELTHDGVYIDLTAFPEEDEYTPSDEDDLIPATHALMQYLNSDCPKGHITMSSDGGGCLPIFDQQGDLVKLDYGRSSTLTLAIQALIKRGLTLSEILPAMTNNPARLLKLHQKGSIESGKDADLVVLDENYGVRDVMVNGKWHIRNSAPVLKGTFE